MSAKRSLVVKRANAVAKKEPDVVVLAYASGQLHDRLHKHRTAFLVIDVRVLFFLFNRD
jgi:hypothetical protein